MLLIILLSDRRKLEKRYHTLLRTLNRNSGVVGHDMTVEKQSNFDQTHLFFFLVNSNSNVWNTKKYNNMV